MGILGILHFLNNSLQETLIVTSAIHLLIFSWIINTLVMFVSSPPPPQKKKKIKYYKNKKKKKKKKYKNKK